MNILVVSRVTTLHSIGGMETLVSDLVNGLAARGCSVTVLTTSIVGFESDFTLKNVKYICLPVKSASYSRMWWRESANYFEINYKKFDIVLSISAAAFSMLNKSNKEKCKFIMQAHGTSLGEIKSKIRTRKIKPILSIVKNLRWILIDLYKYRFFDLIISSGQRVKDDLLSFPYNGVVYSEKIKYMANGINTDIFYPLDRDRLNTRKMLGIDEKTFVIIVASRLTVQKGVYQALDGFIDYKQKYNNNSFLLVVGDGPELSPMEKLIDYHNLNDSAFFTGGVDVVNLANFLRASDVYVFPTLHNEGLPLLPLESLSCGVPVIASSHLHEIQKISDGVYPINPHSVNDISEKIDRCFKIRRDAGSLLPNDYTLDGMLESYLRLFKNYV